MRQPLAPAAVAFVLLVSGCGAGEEVLPKEEVEQGSKAALTKSVGVAPQAVTCPEDLDAEVGASQRCTLTDDKGNELGMTVSVKRVEDGQATYDVEVDGP